MILDIALGILLAVFLLATWEFWFKLVVWILGAVVAFAVIVFLGHMIAAWSL